jgi:hypothetical protein
MILDLLLILTSCISYPIIKPEKVRNLINGHVGDYVGFQADIEGPEHMHSAVHVMMAGDLGGGSFCVSDYDPYRISFKSVLRNMPGFSTTDLCRGADIFS